MNDFTAFPIPNTNIPALPDVSPVTDTSQFIMERAGTGRVNATAIRDYIGAAIGLTASTGIVTPQQFGALANGSNDNLAAINAAIAAVSSAGGIVFFPPGTYAISGPIQIRVPDVTLLGSGAGNWLFGGRGNKGSTIRYTGAVNHGALLDISPVIPSGDFTWCVNCRDMNLDCGLMDIGLLASSLNNSEFANLNVLNAQTVGIYLCAAATTAPGYSLRNNFRNINVTCGAAAHGIVLDGVIGSNPGVGGCAFNHLENVQVTHTNGNGYVILSGDDNIFINCSASRNSGGTGQGLVLNGSSDGSQKRAEANIFIAAIFAANPVGTSSIIRALGGSTPSINNRVQYSQVDGPPTITVDPGATLYYETAGGYTAGAVPQVLQPGLYTLDAAGSSIPNPTRLQIAGGQNNGDVFIGVNGGTAPGSGVNATLPAFTVPVLPVGYAVASLPVMHAANNGCLAYASNGRKPGEGAGAGTGMLVFWSGGAWRSVADGTAIAA